MIGTHRLLGADVSFRDLGLLVVDEEQRFGVAHKERLKRFRAHVDVLTMTATPIPRRSEMALTGSGRCRPWTPRRRTGSRCSPTSAATTKDSRSVPSVASYFGRVRCSGSTTGRDDRPAGGVAAAGAPEARIVVAHGQMDEDQLEPR